MITTPIIMARHVEDDDSVMGRPRMNFKQLEAIVKLMPTGPHSLEIEFQPDERAIKRHLQRKSPIFSNISLEVDSEAKAYVQNPTKGLIIDLYREIQASAISNEGGKFYIDGFVAIWDYSPSKTNYIWIPKAKLFVFDGPNPRHPKYPLQLDLTQFVGDKSGRYGGIPTDIAANREEIASSPHQLYFSADYFKIKNRPNTHVTLTPDEVAVRYSGNKPDYLPKLDKLLKREGRLNAIPLLGTL